MKQAIFHLFYLVFVACLMAACHDDIAAPDPPEDPIDSIGPLPTIAWDEASARFRIYTDETLTLVPIVGNTDSTSTFLWTMNGSVVSRESHYSFLSTEPGEFFVRLVVTNLNGSAEDEAKITVLQSENTQLPEIPAEHRLWYSAWDEINMAMGRTIKIKVHPLEIPENANFLWSLDNAPFKASTLPDKLEYLFDATEQGRHTVTLLMESPAATATQNFQINVCPTAGTYRRSFEGNALVNNIYEFMPAPGHQVNGYIIVGDSYPEDCTHEQACDTVLAHFQRRWSISLGSQGGYLIAGFDHSVRNSGGDYDLCIKGNPYNYQSEPGIIWVSQDDNGDGLPNDQWFELAGSEYGTTRHTTDYAITYYRPAAKKSATVWRDCFGQTGYVPYMSYWNPHDFYWQPWVEGYEHTYFGSRLEDRSTYEGGISDIPPYDWGYADNLGSDFIDGRAGKMNYFRLSNARTWDGEPANLEYIDFIKIQTAQIGSTKNLGDISTEIYYISDYHCE